MNPLFKKHSLLKVIALCVGAYFVLCADSCQTDTVQTKEAAVQNDMQAAGNAAVGYPLLPNHTQKKQFKTILEKFDQPGLVTYTYLIGMHNEVTPICRSQGFGFPESTQFTNPLTLDRRVVDGRSTDGVIANPDPNGLYSPSTSNGTLLMCLTVDGDVTPVRSEPSVFTSGVPWSKLDRTGM